VSQVNSSRRDFSAQVLHFQSLQPATITV